MDGIEVQAVLQSRSRPVRIRPANGDRVVWVKPRLDPEGEFAVNVDDFVKACEHVLAYNKEEE